MAPFGLQIIVMRKFSHQLLINKQTLRLPGCVRVCVCALLQCVCWLRPSLAGATISLFPPLHPLPSHQSDPEVFPRQLCGQLVCLLWGVRQARPGRAWYMYLSDFVYTRVKWYLGWDRHWEGRHPNVVSLLQNVREEEQHLPHVRLVKYGMCFGWVLYAIWRMSGYWRQSRLLLLLLLYVVIKTKVTRIYLSFAYISGA